MEAVGKLSPTLPLASVIHWQAGVQGPSGAYLRGDAGGNALARGAAGGWHAADSWGGARLRKASDLHGRKQVGAYMFQVWHMPVPCSFVQVHEVATAGVFWRPLHAAVSASLSCTAVRFGVVVTWPGVVGVLELPPGVGWPPVDGTPVGVEPPAEGVVGVGLPKDCMPVGVVGPEDPAVAGQMHRCQPQAADQR